MHGVFDIRRYMEWNVWIIYIGLGNGHVPGLVPGSLESLARVMILRLCIISSKKIITIHAHLTAYGLIPSKPAICLLSNGGIEIPLLVTFAKKLRICYQVAILLTKLVLLTMLAFEMEDINSECDITEERIILDSLSKGAVIVEENVIWLCARNTVGLLDHLLLIENTIQVGFWENLKGLMMTL